MIPPPPPSSIRDNTGQAITALRRRCATLGLPSWRCDNTGLIVAEPEDSGPIALLWASSTFTRLISAAAALANKGEAPQVAEVFPGAWAIILPEYRRRTRTGCILMLALSTHGLTGEFFDQACKGAALDAHAIRKLLLPRARYNLESACSLRDAMLWMADDLTHVEESDHTAAGFTRQLSDAFETIDLLYALGRSMSDLTRPEQFVEILASRVRSTLSFGWVAGWLPSENRDGEAHAGTTILSGKTAFAAQFDTALPEILAGLKAESRATILPNFGGNPIPGSGQILVQPVFRAGVPVGLMLAGDKFGDDPQVSSYDIQLLEAAAGYVGAFLENSELYAQQKALSLGVLESLTAAIDAKDTYTRGHSQRVAYLSWQLAMAAGMSPDKAERIRIAGLVHDVGKIGVPEAVLCKSGKLTDDEFAAIKKHPEIGHRILKDLPLLEDILPGVLYHHERWDGKGYPHNLHSERIPPIARIIALADTFDAMSSNRSYRSAMNRATVLAEINKCAGVQFDPELAKLFVKLDFSEFDRMVAHHAAQQPQPAIRAAA
jgi:HD-GYP domain-containing protein (c-di-GMP phosphodiesterase class II)